VDRRYGQGVCGPNADFGAARTISGLIRDRGAASCHACCAWDYLAVHLERSGKVSGSKRCRDVPHVVSDRDDPGGVREILCIKDDAPAILKVLKHVRRRVLVHAHDSLTAYLHGRECTVRLVPGGLAPAPARDEWNHKGEGEDLHSVLSSHGWLGGA